MHPAALVTGVRMIRSIIWRYLTLALASLPQSRAAPILPLLSQDSKCIQPLSLVVVLLDPSFLLQPLILYYQVIGIM